jgi:hypothetical protein
VILPLLVFPALAYPYSIPIPTLAYHYNCSVRGKGYLEGDVQLIHTVIKTICCNVLLRKKTLTLTLILTMKPLNHKRSHFIVISGVHVGVSLS